jgi:predicted RecA/RadA family phage recombinase
MQNFVQEGKILTLTAPYARSAGEGALVGSIFGVACNDVLLSAAGEFWVGEGVFTLTKTDEQAWSVGDKIYWNNSTKACTTVATDGMLIGYAAEAVLVTAGLVTGKVRLNGSTPSTAEGPQGAIAILTDSTGGSGTHDDTLADGLTSVATAASTYTPSIDDSAVVAQADAQGDIEPAAAGACAGDATPSAAQVDTAIATAVAPLTANDATLAVALKQVRADLEAMRTTVGTLVTDATVQNQNDSDLAQKIIEIRAALIAAGILAAA